RYGVGIPRRRSDEEPQVAGREQFPGELAVRRHHGVDVWGVEQGDPRPERGGVDQLERSFARPGRTSEIGEDVVAGEPGDVAGVADQQGRPGRRSDHTGAAYRSPDEAVDKGRFAGPGRSADDGEQRRVDAVQPREDITV